VCSSDDVDSGAKGVDVLHTDVWVSMGEPQEMWAERIGLLMPFQANARMLERTGKPGRQRSCTACPPTTTSGRRSAARSTRSSGWTPLEVTDEVFAGPASVVFDQAENRMRSIKAVLVATLA